MLNITKAAKELLDIVQYHDKYLPDDEIAAYLRNHMLIHVYTCYEQYVKRLITSTLDTYCALHYCAPLLRNISPHTETWVPNLKKTEIPSYFPLITSWVFWDISEYRNIDTLILARHNYAHTGSHPASIENILAAFAEITHVILFLENTYKIPANFQEYKRGDLEKLLKRESNLYKSNMRQMKILQDLENSSLEYLPESVMSTFLNSYEEIKIWQSDIKLIPLLADRQIDLKSIPQYPTKTSTIKQHKEFCKSYSLFYSDKYPISLRNGLQNSKANLVKLIETYILNNKDT